MDISSGKSAGEYHGRVGTHDRATADWLGAGTLTGSNTLLLMPSVEAVMTIVALFAAVVPARRGLAVQPSEALRDE